MRKATFALFPVLIMLVLLSPAPSREAAATIETGVYTEDFATYAHSDYINQTAWDVFAHQLRLRRISGVDVCSYAGCFSALAWKGEDSFYVVWADIRSSDYAIYAQRLDNRGNRLWPADVRISTGLGEIADIAVDAEGNALVVWSAYLDESVRLQKISPEGVLLLEEKQIATGYGIYWPLIYPSHDRNTFWVSWLKSSNFYASKIDGQGNVLYTGQINAGSFEQNSYGFSMAVDANDSLWAAWYHSMEYPSGEIRLQVLNPDGSRKWEQDQTIASGTFPMLSPAPGGGVYLKWHQYGLGGRLQRLQPDGSKAWAQDLEMWLGENDTSVDTDSQGNLWIACGNGQDIAVQKVAPDGSQLFPNPIWIRSTHTNYGEFPTIRVDSRGTAAITFIDNRNTVEEIRLQMLSEQGALAWPTEKLLADDLGAAIQNSPAIKVAQDGTTYLAWKDSRQGQAQIYVQSLASDGSRRWGTDLIANTLSSNIRISQPKVTLLGQDETVLVVWYAGTGQYNYDGALFIQKFDTNGNRLRPEELRLLDTDYFGDVTDIPAIAANTDGGFTVAWATASTLHIQRFNADGDPVWPADVTVSGDSSTLNQYLAISSAPDDSTAVMFFKNEGTMNEGAIYVLRLNSAGQPSWPAPIMVNWQSGGPSFSLAMDNGGNAIISWAAAYKIWSQKYAPTGERLWNNGTAIEIGDVFVTAALVSIAPGDHPTYVGVDSDSYIGDPSRVLYIRQFEPEGQPVWDQQFTITQTGLLHPKAIADTSLNGDVVAAWEDTRYGNQDILALKLHSNGSLVLPYPIQVVNPDSFYSLQGTARSDTVDVLDGRILEANLTADYDLNGGSLAFYLSNDGGTSWEAVVPGINHRFASHGSDLRWQVDMTADPLWPRGPIIRSVQINYSALPPGADDYEPDDACSQAQPIETAGVPQLHTFHGAADEDWVQFDARAGQIYVIQANNAAENADPALELHDACGGNSLATADNLGGHDVRLNWTAPISSSVYLQVRNTFGVTATVSNGYELSVRAFDPSPIVVIVAGKADTPEQQSAMDYSADLAYRTFLNAGVVKAHLRYFSPSGSRDVDGDGNVDDITGAPHPDVIRDSIQDWARGQGAALGIPFYLVLIGPGDTDVFYAGETGESISATDLNLWLANLEATSGTDAINVVIESSKSGSFIDVTDLGPATVSGYNRVLLTSTSSTLDSYLTPEGAYFTNALFNALGQEMDLHAAFEEAVAAVQAAGVDQQPWLDDDGDALPENINLTSSIRTISALPDNTKALVSSDRGLSTSRSMAPEIRQVENQPIGQTVVRIRVQATDDGSISQVNAAAHPCAAAIPSGKFPVIRPTVYLLPADPGQPGWFAANVDSANVCWYALYAIDVEGNRSAPSVLILQRRVFLPLINR